MDASACKTMLLRFGSGKVNHLRLTQIWVQGAIQRYGVEVQKVPRVEFVSDIMTPHGGSELKGNLRRIKHHTPAEYHGLERC